MIRISPAVRLLTAVALFSACGDDGSTSAATDGASTGTGDTGGTGPGTVDPDGTSSDGGTTTAQTPADTGTTATSASTSDSTSDTEDPPTGTSSTDDDAGTDTGTDSSSGDTGVCPMPAPGVWVDCPDGDSCMSDEAACIGSGQDGEGSCIFTPPGATGCDDVCDCPAEAPTGTAPVTCEDIIGPGGALDGVNECFLSCGMDEQCPDGQTCIANLLCMHTNTPPGPPVDPYLGCVPPLFPCQPGFICLLDDVDDPTVGTCTQLDCMDESDCAPAPAGGTVVCSDVFGEPELECTLECDDDDDCPAGATCLANLLCLFPIPEVGYQSCGVIDECLDDESCFTLPGDPTVNVCTTEGCTDASDCPVAGYDGEAEVACGDIGGGLDACYLDCALGEACPTNMVCADDLFCAFESVGELCDIVADPSFEAGTPSLDWAEASTAFGTPLCNAAGCGVADGAFAGDAWVWFGGIAGEAETASIEQSVVIPAGATELVFQLQIAGVTTTNPDLDTLTLSIDGVEELQITGDDAATYAAYTQVIVDVSAYANDMSHAIRLEGVTQGDELTSFFVDDVVVLCPST
ncbi:MAG: hypothetical protein JKY37_02200 [Nannocystaceae bacterium]|nr:hypothetical protein [Nannocystaceae bacterium]